jgi:hypothetical protein
MSDIKKDEVREDRIIMEIVVDAYGSEEQAMGWYCYLDEMLEFPFKACCTQERRISPLKVGEVVLVKGMAIEDDCMREMFVEIEWQGRTIGVPLAQLQGIGIGDDTQQAIDDWHYWVKMGYKL